MAIDILLTIVVTSVVQSIFGAGVLLFGYDFVDALVVLLPISIVINLLQVTKHHAQIDSAFFRRVLVLTLPPIAVCLFLITPARVNIGLMCGAFLILNTDRA